MNSQSRRNRLRRAARAAETQRLQARRRFLEAEIAKSQPENLIYHKEPEEASCTSKKAFLNLESAKSSQHLRFPNLQERRRMLEISIAKDTISMKPKNKSMSFANYSEVEKFSVDEMDNLMEPEISIETPEDLDVNFPSDAYGDDQQQQDSNPYAKSSRSRLIISKRFEREPTHRKPVPVAYPTFTKPPSQMVEVPFGRIPCNFGHVIEQARKLERHRQQCGLGGEMVFDMILKTGTVYQCVYKCNQPECAVSMTIESDFQEGSYG